MHSVARPFLALRFSISCNSVTSTRAPDAPIGCPSAIAPPLTLTLPVSQPRSLLTAQAWAANASFASMRSRSAIDQPAFLRAARDAGIGPVPMMAGSTPAWAQDTMRANTLRFSLAASLAFISTTLDGISKLRPAFAKDGSVTAVLGEGGAQLTDAVERGAVLGKFIGVDDDVALARLDDDGRDLVLEPPGLLGRFRPVLRADREFILLLTGDLPLPGDVFGGVAHVVAVE